MIMGEVRENISREGIVNQLYSLFNEPETPVPPIYITGGPSTGKTSVIQDTLSSLFQKYKQSYEDGSASLGCYTFVDCATHFSVRSILEEMIEQIQSACNNNIHTKRCVYLYDFISFLVDFNSQGSIYLVFDNAERLSNKHYFEPSFVDHLLMLDELTEKNVCPIFISRIPYYSCFKEARYTRDPIEIVFPPYSENTMLAIINQNFVPQNADKELFKFFSRILLQIFWNRCNDLRELVSIYFYPSFAEQAKGKSNATLFGLARMHILAYTNVYRRDIPQIDTPPSNPLSNIWQGSLTSGRDAILPYFTKYLIIASYLANAIPPSKDDELFSATIGKRKKTAKAKKATPSKYFTQHRMLYIFSKISQDENTTATSRGKVVSRIQIQYEISSLVNQNLLTHHGGGDGMVKLQCNADYNFVSKIAAMVGFDLRKYLSVVDG